MTFPIPRDLLEAVDAEMRHVVGVIPDDDAGFSVMLRYPLGWVETDGSRHTEPTGKRVRPLLLLMCAQAAGGDWREALPAAAAVELLHNFSLIHDDIEDNSPMRHGRPTVWKVWGLANAINAGDALFTLAFAAMQRLTTPPALTLRAIDLFTQTTLQLTRGQHLDMRFEHERDVPVESYVTMISGKTAALLGLCAELGALIACGDPDRAAKFGEFGVNLGIAFQIHDDILGIWGNEAVTGKSASSDIVTRKKSLPVLYGLTRDTRLRELYDLPEFGPAQVTEVIRLLNALGADEYARDLEQEYSAKSEQALKAARPEPEPEARLKALIAALFERKS